MGKMKSLALIIAAAVCVLIVAYFLFRAISSLKQGYSWQEMDWQQRGKTSLKGQIRDVLQNIKGDKGDGSI